MRLVPALEHVEGAPPPHDLHVERIVLSPAICGQHVAEVVEGLEVTDFFSLDHQRVFEALRTLHHAGGVIDMVMIGAQLNRAGLYETIGGLAGLERIAFSTPDAANVGRNMAAHIALLREKARARRVMLVLQVAGAEARGDVGSIDAWIEDLPSRIAAAAGVSTTKGVTTIAEAFKQTFADLEHGGAAGFKTGLEAYDRITGGLHGGDVLLLKAKKKSGKSVLCGQWALKVAEAVRFKADTPADCRGCGDWPCPAHTQRFGALIFALEGKTRDWATRLGCSRARVDYHALRTGTAGPRDFDKLMFAAAEIARMPVGIDDRKDLTIERYRARIRTFRDELAAKGILLGLVVLDNMQLWKPGDDRRDRRHVLDEAMAGILEYAGTPEMAGTATIVVSQVNTEGEAFECKTLANHADAIISVSIDKEKDNFGSRAGRIFIEEQRRGPADEVVPVWFRGPFTLFEDGGRGN